MPRLAHLDRPIALLAACAALLIITNTSDAQAPVELDTILAEHGCLTSTQRDALVEKLRNASLELDTEAEVIRGVSRLLGPSVVHIEADIVRDAPSRSGRVRRVEEAGAGVLVAIDDRYYVLTNRHVVHGASNSAVSLKLLDGRVLNPTKMWDDPNTDIAVLAIEGADLVPARVGNSDQVDVGEAVLAVGSPFGLTRSVTAGIISATGRRNLELGTSNVTLQDFLQTDAAINPGNSGGPLVNARGEVVGVITAIASNSGGSEGVGFAIPINMFMKVARMLVKGDSTGHALLGVTLDSAFTIDKAKAAGLPYAVGARVARIVEGSPAEKAGLRVGDVILKIDGVLIDDDNHLVDTVGLRDAGERITLIVVRDEKAIEVPVTLAAKR